MGANLNGPNVDPTRIMVHKEGKFFDRLWNWSERCQENGGNVREEHISDDN
jgi:hypothetical protein